jgi:hypothetical protein
MIGASNFFELLVAIAIFGIQSPLTLTIMSKSFRSTGYADSVKKTNKSEKWLSKKLKVPAND